MRVITYDPSDMSEIASGAPSIDFGDMVRGQHGSVVAIQPATSTESSFTELALFLENDGGLRHSVFHKFQSSTPIHGIEPGSNYLSDYFIPITGISDVSQIGLYSDFGIFFDADSPEYAWLDVESSVAETGIGVTSVNFRFVFEYF
jgi:hypothetical protein